MTPELNLISKIKLLYNIMFVVWGITIVTFTPIEILPQYKLLVENGFTSLNFGFLFFLIVALNIIANQFNSVYFKLISESLYSLPLLLLFLSTITNNPPALGGISYLFLTIVIIMIINW